MSITVTPIALMKLKVLVGDHFGIRLSVQKKGCSGLAYDLSFAEQKEPYDEEILMDGVRLLVDPKALLFVTGTTIDYETESFSEGFIFRNPNEKSRCHCGKSFCV